MEARNYNQGKKREHEKSLSEVHESVLIPEKRGFFRTLLAFFGPAYMVSVGYMDPGNWATDIAGGSHFGYSLIWVLLMSNLMALLLQSLAARLGVVKGWDLAQASRQQYPQWANISLYLLAEIAIAACDLAEIIGMAIGLKLLFGLPMMIGVLVTVLDTFLLMFLLSKGIRKMEAFILSLVAIIGVSFLLEMIIVEPHLGQVAKGFIPSTLNHEALYIAIGIIGATVMPHNLYLHSSLVQTRKFAKDEHGIRKALKFNLIDSTVALNLAFFVNAAILILAGSAFYQQGIYTVTGIEHAHLLLKNIFGNMAPALFAIALICAGQSSTVTGTLAGQIVMEGYINLRISPWVRRLLTRLIAIIPAALTLYFFGDGSMDSLLILSQVILSMQLGFAIIPLIHFTSSERIMGMFKIKPIVRLFAWMAAIIIVGLNVKLVRDELGSLYQVLPADFRWLFSLILIIVGYVAFLLIYITFEPFIKPSRKAKDVVPHGEAIELGEIKKTEYKYIALTVDFSKKDRSTIHHALSLGGKSASYLLIHVVESAGAIGMGETIRDTETEYDRYNLQKYKDELALMGYQVFTELGFGKSANVIPSIVNSKPVDLLVMGAHGHKGLKDILFGSTVDSVRHRVKVPVLIVK